MTLLGKIVRRPPGEVLMAAEAFLLLAVFRAGLAMVPLRRVLKAVMRGDGPGATGAEMDSEARRAARLVRWAVSAAARHSPIEFVCLPQALAAYTMLRRRGFASTLIYGVARSEGGELLAHTWLAAAGETVVGGETASEFTAIEQWT